MTNGELQLLLVYGTETGCLRAPLLSNTETIKWLKVYVLIPIILIEWRKDLSIPIVRHNTVVKGLSIPVSETIGLVKCLSIPIVPNNRFGERYIDTYRSRNNRFRLVVPIVYRSNRHALEIPIDGYLLQDRF